MDFKKILFQFAYNLLQPVMRHIDSVGKGQL